LTQYSTASRNFNIATRTFEPKVGTIGVAG
jgi:hypothetical protein